MEEDGSGSREIEGATSHAVLRYNQAELPFRTPSLNKQLRLLKSEKRKTHSLMWQDEENAEEEKKEAIQRGRDREIYGAREDRGASAVACHPRQEEEEKREAQGNPRRTLVGIDIAVVGGR